MNASALTVTVRLRGIWRVTFAIWLVEKALVFLEWNIKKLEAEIE